MSAPMPEQKACCFRIPSGAKTVAIIEFVFIGICAVAVILGFVGGRILESVFNMLFLIGLGVCAFLLMKAVKENRDGLCLPYAILKIIHLVFQGILVVALLVVVAGLSTAHAVDDRFRNETVGIAIGASVFYLILHGAWFILGIIFVVVAFKTRTWIKTSQATQPPMGGVVIGQPGYAQPPPAYPGAPGAYPDPNAGYPPKA